MKHHAPMFERLDERQEVGTVDSVLIQVIAGAVRGCDQDHSSLPENTQQPRDYPCVGDVRDLELVEAQHSEFLGELQPHTRHGIELWAETQVHRSAVRGEDAAVLVMDALVDLEHEFVEVSPALRESALVEEEVHEHRLPAPHRAVEVDSLARLLGGLETTKKLVEDLQHSYLRGVLSERSIAVALQ